MICQCGRALGCNIEMQMTCKCGESHIVQPDRSPYPKRLSERVRDAAPELFTVTADCKCQDVAALLDKWGFIKSIQNADKLAALISQPTANIVRAIQDASPLEDGLSGERVELTVADPVDRDDVRLVTVHFNPCRYQRQRETYHEWLPYLGQLAEHLRCYELVYDDDEPEIEGSLVIRGSRMKNLMFQKEALINIALSQTPPGVRYFGWLDHDIVIKQSDWLQSAIEQIDAGAIAVQCWSRLLMLDLERIPTATKYGAASHEGNGAPGGVWLADRAYMDSIGGLHPYHVTGGGDVAFFSAVSGHHANYLKTTSERYWKQTQDWIARASRIRDNRRIGTVESTAYHFFHGSMKGRQYVSRSKILSGDFDPLQDLRINEDGILEWSSDKPGIHRHVRKYFEGRAEDVG